jgi:hypothetical protein
MRVPDKCNYCEKPIFSITTREGEYKFCNSLCRDRAYEQIAANLSEDSIRKQTWEIHSSACSLCNGSGPIDAHISCFVLSLVYFSYSRFTPHICCRKCGRIKQVKGLLISLFFGWWSIPGIIATPIFIVRNLRGLFKRIDTSRPSNMLCSLIQQQNEIRIMRVKSAINQSLKNNTNKTPKSTVKLEESIKDVQRPLQTSSKAEQVELNILNERLLQLLYGDREQSKRLVNLERKRSPKKSEIELYKDAIFHLEWDRRR